MKLSIRMMRSVESCSGCSRRWSTILSWTGCALISSKSRVVFCWRRGSTSNM
ncbi:hypothetical protein BDV95DRAFT_572327, partial [Massariosphaeria phaeospora]